jgi:hypothetical protein
VASSYLRFERHVLEEKARKNFIRDLIQYEASEITEQESWQLTSTIFLSHEQGKICFTRS